MPLAVSTLDSLSALVVVDRARSDQTRRGQHAPRPRVRPGALGHGVSRAARTRDQSSARDSKSGKSAAACSRVRTTYRG